MLILNIEYCKKSDAAHGAASVEVCFVDAELVGYVSDGSRWEELSRGGDAEGGDLASVCNEPAAEYFGTDACCVCDLVFTFCFHSRKREG